MIPSFFYRPTGVSRKTLPKINEFLRICLTVNPIIDRFAEGVA